MDETSGENKWCGPFPDEVWERILWRLPGSGAEVATVCRWMRDYARRAYNCKPVVLPGWYDTRRVFAMQFRWDSIVVLPPAPEERPLVHLSTLPPSAVLESLELQTCLPSVQLPVYPALQLLQIKTSCSQLALPAQHNVQPRLREIRYHGTTPAVVFHGTRATHTRYMTDTEVRLPPPTSELLLADSALDELHLVRCTLSMTDFNQTSGVTSARHVYIRDCCQLHGVLYYRLRLTQRVEDVQVDEIGTRDDRARLYLDVDEPRTSELHVWLNDVGTAHRVSVTGRMFVLHDTMTRTKRKAT